MVDVDRYITEFQNGSHQKITDAYPDDTVKRLRTNLQTCMELGDEKVALAVQTYELVCTLEDHSFDPLDPIRVSFLLIWIIFPAGR